MSTSDIILNLTNLVGTSYAVSNLDHNKQYFWHVLASNDFVASDWSKTFSFTTQSQTESASNIIFPASNVSYSNRVQPLFDQTCNFCGCHDNGTQQSEPVLTLYGEAVLKVTGVVVPGKPDASTLVLRIQGSIGLRMPPGTKSLNQNQINGIRTWTAEGAKNN